VDPICKKKKKFKCGPHQINFQFFAFFKTQNTAPNCTKPTHNFLGLFGNVLENSSQFLNAEKNFSNNSYPKSTPHGKKLLKQ
jgi:hypothetical protein